MFCLQERSIGEFADSQGSIKIKMFIHLFIL
jgi:hypothetical protein